MIAGELIASEDVQSSDGQRVRLNVYRAEPGPENARALTLIGQLWYRQSEAADQGGHRDPAFRAFFAGTAAFIAADRVADHECCVLVAEDAATDEVLGLAVYTPGPGEWWLNDVTVSPRNQPDFPAAVQVRGVGSALLAQVAEAADAEPGCNRISLYPLDDAAERFWRARGFHSRNDEPPYHLTCDEVHRLAERNRQAGPDCPDHGDCVGAGNRADHLRAATPRVAGRIYARR